MKISVAWGNQWEGRQEGNKRLIAWNRQRFSKAINITHCKIRIQFHRWVFRYIIRFDIALTWSNNSACP